MSHSFIDPKNDYYNVNDDSDTTQKKIDPVAQAKWLSTPQVHGGWGLFHNPPAQMFASDEEEEKQRKPEEDLLQGKAEDEELQMKEKPVEKQGSSGTQTSIPNDVRGKMENSFGTDFSGVNIHQNSDQASNIGALAYTQGNDVHFAPGQYNPGSTKGQELLGHELTHVVQQRQGRVKPTKQGKGLPVNDNPELEKEADVMGAKAAQGKMADVAGNGSGVQKKGESEPPYFIYDSSIYRSLWFALHDVFNLTSEEIKIITEKHPNYTDGDKIFLPLRCIGMLGVIGSGNNVDNEQIKIIDHKITGDGITVWDLAIAFWWKIDSNYLKAAADEIIMRNGFPSQGYKYKIEPGTTIKLPVPINMNVLDEIVVRPEENKVENIATSDNELYGMGDMDVALNAIYDAIYRNMLTAIEDFDKQMAKQDTKINYSGAIRDGVIGIAGNIPYLGDAISHIAGSSLWAELRRVDEVRKINSEIDFSQEYRNKINDFMNSSDLSMAIEIQKQEYERKLYGITDPEEKMKFGNQTRIEMIRTLNYVKTTTLKKAQKGLVISFLDQVKNATIRLNFGGTYDKPVFGGMVTLHGTDHDGYLTEYINDAYNGIPIPIYDYNATFVFNMPNMLKTTSDIDIKTINAKNDGLRTLLFNWHKNNYAGSKNIGKVIKMNDYYLPVPNRLY